MFNFMRVLLAGLVLFSGGAFANDYYHWVTAYNGSATGPSPQAVCSEVFGRMGMSSTYVANTETSGYCTYEGSGNTGPGVSRYGSSCPPDTQYNSETGECTSKDDECKTQEPERLEFLYCYDYEGTGGCSAGTATPRPSSFCSGGCAFEPNYSAPDADTDCYSYFSGSEGTPSGPAVMCGVTSKSSGACSAGTPDDPVPSPSNECPSGTSAGVVNGKNICVPSSGGGSDGGDTGGGDGDGGDTGGGNESGGDTGGDGDGTGGDSGGGDTGSGGNTGGGNSGGTGDTGGTGGTGDGEGEGSGTGESVGNCDDGRCSFGDERGDPFDGEVRSFSESMEAFHSGLKSSPISSAISNIKFPSGGVCPTGSTSIHLGFGSIPIEFSEHCNLWAQIAPILSAVFLALWAIIAVRVFLSA